MIDIQLLKDILNSNKKIVLVRFYIDEDYDEDRNAITYIEDGQEYYHKLYTKPDYIAYDYGDRVRIVSYDGNYSLEFNDEDDYYKALDLLENSDSCYSI